LQNNVFIN
jgi:hypothetical protein